ncbi:MAG: hypothetical protein WA885_22905 [Phormidesmis sp.]
MTKPDFEKMTRKDLKAYVVRNLEDEEAIQFLIKTAKSSGPGYPYPKTEAEMKEQQAMLMEKIKQLNNEGDVA